jgi:hypothetical protein
MQDGSTTPKELYKTAAIQMENIIRQYWVDQKQFAENRKAPPVQQLSKCSAAVQDKQGSILIITCL